MSDYPITNFTGDCGEGTSKDHPKCMESNKGLQCNEEVAYDNNTNLSTSIRANDGGCVYGITLTGSPGVYDYVLNVDAQGPSGFGSGGMHLAFTDESDDTYYLYVYSSSRSVHTVRYNSKMPAIKKIWWSNYGFDV